MLPQQKIAALLALLLDPPDLPAGLAEAFAGAIAAFAALDPASRTALIESGRKSSQEVAAEFYAMVAEEAAKPGASQANIELAQQLRAKGLLGGAEVPG